MLGVIFGVLNLLLVGFVMTAALFLETAGGILEQVREFFWNTRPIWLVAFGVGTLAVSKLINLVTGVWTAVVAVQICAIAFGVLFGVVPLINANRWNADFKCDSGVGCNVDDECVIKLCWTPFRGEFIGKSEFTQAGYMKYLTDKAVEECGQRKDIRTHRQFEACEAAAAAGAVAKFQEMIGPGHCRYLKPDDTVETAIYTNDDAPMVCLDHDEAAAVCADFGGRLPSADDYDWMFDDLDDEPSCLGAVMSGLDEYHGHAKKQHEREIAALRPGPGCGTGKFRRVCRKTRHGNTDDGVCDVLGNVAEWTSEGTAIGGAFWNTAADMRTPMDVAGAASWIGFRCLINDNAVLFGRDWNPNMAGK